MTSQVLSSLKVNPHRSLLFSFQNYCRLSGWTASSKAIFLQHTSRNMSTIAHFHTSSVSSILPVKLLPVMYSMHPNQLPLSRTNIQSRGVVNYSKRRGKRKTVKAVAKRFYRTGSGKLKYWPAGHVHNMLGKSFNRRRSLRKPRYASKIQMKTLNKMISGW